MAATFVNMETDKAFRVVSKEEARDLAALYAPEVSGKAQQQLLAYQRMPDSLLFTVQKADVHVGEFDLPGPTRAKAKCALCGQVVRDKREVVMEGVTLCRPCAHGAYYRNAQEVEWPDMDWAPEDAPPVSPRDFQSLPAEIHKARN